MYRSVHKKNPIKIGEGGKLLWGKNEYVLTHTWFSGGGGGNSVYTHFSGGEISVYTNFSGGKTEGGGGE